MSELDLEQFRLPIRIQANKSEPKKSIEKQYMKTEQKYPFLKGPIPRWWLERAATLPGKAFTIGVVLWYRMGVTKKIIVQPSWKLWAKFSIGRHAAYRGLHNLENAGLISVQRCIGKNPLVTVTTMPAPEWDVEQIKIREGELKNVV